MEKLVGKNMYHKNIKHCVKQKIYGIFIIICTCIICSSSLAYSTTMKGNDWTIALLTVPLGLYLIFARHRLV